MNTPLKESRTTLVKDLKLMEDILYEDWQRAHLLGDYPIRDRVLDLIEAVTYLRGCAAFIDKTMSLDVRATVGYTDAQKESIKALIARAERDDTIDGDEYRGGGTD